MPTDPISKSTGANSVTPVVPREPRSSSPSLPTPPAPMVIPLAPAHHAGQIPIAGSPLELQLPTLMPPLAPLPQPAPVAGVLALESSVGTGGKNRTDDVRIVQHILALLGYPVKEDGAFGGETSRCLKIFASVCADKERWDTMSDRVTSTNDLARWLAHPNAERWSKVPTEGKGFKAIDRDGYGWATSHTIDTIVKAGELYQAKRDATATATPPIMINDLSRKNGDVLFKDKSPEHQTHRNGMDIDVRLPRIGGDTVPQEGTEVSSANYDREATYLMVDSFASLPAVTRILLYDAKIKERAVAEGKPWAEKLVLDADHYHHVHVDVEAQFLAPIDP